MSRLCRSSSRSARWALAAQSAGSLLATLAIGGITAVAMLFVGRFLLPHLFAQAARAKNPELFLAACLLVVIIASLVTSAIGFSPCSER